MRQRGGIMNLEKEFEEIYKIRRERPFDSHKDTAKEFWLVSRKATLEWVLENIISPIKSALPRTAKTATLIIKEELEKLK
jgi:hypothetical protein